MTGGLHADEGLAGSAGLFQARQDALIPVGIVVEGSRSIDALSIAIDDLGDVLVLGDVDASEPCVSFLRSHRSCPSWFDQGVLSQPLGPQPHP